MYIPKPKKTPTGYRIQLRIGGESIPVTDVSEKMCIKKAAAIKAQYKLNGIAEKAASENPTLRKAIDHYIAERKNAISPATVRTYRNIQKNRFKSIMDRPIKSIKQREWQGIVDAEHAHLAPKTVKNSWGLIKSVLSANDVPFPDKLTTPRSKPTRKIEWLEPDEIKAFVKAAKEDEYCIPMLLALMSMRISEIDALLWENIDPKADFIETSGSRVMDESSHWVTKDTEKTEDSHRKVPLLIPELKQAIIQKHQRKGKLLDAHQMTLRRAVERTCERAGVKRVTVHQLRHSFASLSAHLGIPKEISMEIGGWSNDKTMDEIYTHICRSDIERYKTAMYYFYNPTAQP